MPRRRLTAAMLAAAGRTAGMTTTDHIAVGHTVLDAGDFSGPGGARTLLRDRRVEAAVLETARDGLLRRGLALGRQRQEGEALFVISTGEKPSLWGAVQGILGGYEPGADTRLSQGP